MSKIKPETIRKNIRKSLILQLESKGANVAHFLNMVEDYMSFYDTKILLQKDIDENGIKMESFNARGDCILKNNPSVTDLVKVNNQMLKILSELGLNTDSVASEEYDAF